MLASGFAFGFHLVSVFTACIWFSSSLLLRFFFTSGFYLHPLFLVQFSICAGDCYHKVYWNAFLHYHGLQAENISSFQLNEDLDFPRFQHPFVELCSHPLTLMASQASSLRNPSRSSISGVSSGLQTSGDRANDDELFLQAAGGVNKKGFVYGLGNHT
ncbi:hypothetical protein Cgig2_021402 [Carnegiea gigantea]|uniref:Uncharacterized protein n=1 Tax=Carnegiea gigantea TaxID=171969 RepID=A0A9Q1GJF5_9CARY|nr:hypothetical protein Cgig2_021402 [Carnegiea gigantea]